MMKIEIYSNLLNTGKKRRIMLINTNEKTSKDYLLIHTKATLMYSLMWAFKKYKEEWSIDIIGEFEKLFKNIFPNTWIWNKEFLELWQEWELFINDFEIIITDDLDEVKQKIKESKSVEELLS